MDSMVKNAESYLDELDVYIKELIAKKEKALSQLDEVIKAVNEQTTTLSRLKQEANVLEVENIRIANREIQRAKDEKATLDRELSITRNDLNLTNHHLGEATRKLERIKEDIGSLEDKTRQLEELRKDGKRLFDEAKALNDDTTRKRDEFIKEPQSIGFYVKALEKHLEEKGLKMDVLDFIQKV